MKCLCCMNSWIAIRLLVKISCLCFSFPCKLVPMLCMLSEFWWFSNSDTTWWYVECSWRHRCPAGCSAPILVRCLGDVTDKSFTLASCAELDVCMIVISCCYVLLKRFACLALMCPEHTSIDSIWVVYSLSINFKRGWYMHWLVIVGFLPLQTLAW